MPSFLINMTNLTKVNNTFVDIMKFVNQEGVTNGLFFIGTVFLVWIILFVGMMPFGEKKALLVSAFVASVYSYILAAMGLMDISLTFIPTMVVIFALFLNMLQSGSN